MATTAAGSARAAILAVKYGPDRDGDIFQRDSSSSNSLDLHASCSHRCDPGAFDAASQMRSNIALDRLLTLRESLPLTKEQAKEAAELVKQISTTDLSLCGLGVPDRPTLPPNIDKIPIKKRLAALQDYISAFQYNHTDAQYFNVLKSRPLARVMDTAKEIVRRSLPIKCVEAVFLGLYLTAGMAELDRFPVGFKTQVDGHVYRHIILVIKHRPTSTYGAVGLSRRSTLGYKELKFPSMADVLEDYKTAYETWWHQVDKIRVGLAVSHDTFSTRPVCWRYFVYKVSKTSWEKIRQKIDGHCGSACSSKLFEKWMLTGQNHAESEKKKRQPVLPAGYLAYNPPKPAKPVQVQNPNPISTTRKSSQEPGTSKTAVKNTKTSTSANMKTPYKASKKQSLVQPQKKGEKTNHRQSANSVVRDDVENSNSEAQDGDNEQAIVPEGNNAPLNGEDMSQDGEALQQPVLVACQDIDEYMVIEEEIPEEVIEESIDLQNEHGEELPNKSAETNIEGIYPTESEVNDVPSSEDSSSDSEDGGSDVG